MDSPKPVGFRDNRTVAILYLEGILLGMDQSVPPKASVGTTGPDSIVSQNPNGLLSPAARLASSENPCEPPPITTCSHHHGTRTSTVTCNILT